MEETRGITVKVRESLHGKAKKETEETNQTMSQFIEKVLQYYFDGSGEKEMANGNRRTLAFQVSEEFYTEVQEHIKSRGIKLKDFGIAALRKALDEAASAEPAVEAVETGEDDTATSYGDSGEGEPKAQQE